jgi:hypothetical protein
MKSIFALIDPRIGRVAYVGTTDTNYNADQWLAFEHRSHRMNLDKGRRHAAWESLMQAQPTAILLERTSDPEAGVRWINLLIAAGHPLINTRGVNERARMQSEGKTLPALTHL